jgi:hypothetical protein
VPATAVLLLAAAVGCAAPTMTGTAHPQALVAGTAATTQAPPTTTRAPATTEPAAAPVVVAAPAPRSTARTKPPVATPRPAPAPKPVPKPAPAAKPPARAATGGCNSNYSPCVPDDPKDVDCRGGSGNGPSYVAGPVRVTGSDVYGLDRDGDGVGCE